MQSQECKKQRCMRMESLHHDIVERIFERVPAKSLMRFKAVSKPWKTTIESRFFQERQLRNREQSGDPDVLMVSVTSGRNVESLRTLVLGSSSSVKIPTPWENTFYSVSLSTCDGLVCLYDHFKSGFVVNPTTRWYRPLPLCNLQQLVIDRGYSYVRNSISYFKLGFGKDKFTGTYKPVWLYNSEEIGLDQATTCEVFDFCTNSWRYVTPPAHRVVAHPDPVFVDGSLHWFTECKKTKVLAFDLHTEAFQIVSKAPAVAAKPFYFNIIMCNLDNRLCVSEMKWPDQIIWSFHSSNKTWDKMYSIDLDLTHFWYAIPTGPIRRRRALLPLALLDGEKKKNKKLLFFDRMVSRALFTHGLGTPSYDVAFLANSIGYPVCYFPSLFSI